MLAMTASEIGLALAPARHRNSFDWLTADIDDYDAAGGAVTACPSWSRRSYALPPKEMSPAGRS